MFGIGKLIDIGTEALGLPEPLGDIAKIGIGVVTKNPALIADGCLDLAPDALGLLKDSLDLGDAEPGEPDSFFKTLLSDGFSFLEKELARSSNQQALLQAFAPG